MNSKFLASLLLGALPLSMVAQDDVYFVPSKKAVEREAASYGVPRHTYYAGSNRDVDEYNRRGGSYYQVLSNDTTGNDTISFDGQRGVYPDSVDGGQDYALTRRMARYDGYAPDIAYEEGYRDGWHNSWAWHSPWYYSSYYPWYDSYWYWNDPWYYGRYGRFGWYSSYWYDPWYYDYGWYGYYGWRRPYYYSYYTPRYYGGVSYTTGRTFNDRRMVSQTRRGVSNGRSTQFGAGTFGGSAINNRQTATRNSRTSTPMAYPRTTVPTTNSHGTFGGNRMLGNSAGSSSNRSAGSFGGSSMSRSAGSMGSFGGGGGGGVSTRGGSRSSRR